MRHRRARMLVGRGRGSPARHPEGRTARRAHRAHRQSSRGMNSALLSPIGPNQPRLEEWASVLHAKRRYPSSSQPELASSSSSAAWSYPESPASDVAHRPEVVRGARDHARVAESRLASRAAARSPGEAIRAPSTIRPTRSPRRELEAMVRRVRGRGRGRVETDAAQLARHACEHGRVGRRRRAVVDHHDLDVARSGSRAATAARGTATYAVARAPCRTQRPRR